MKLREGVPLVVMRILPQVLLLSQVSVAAPAAARRAAEAAVAFTLSPEAEVSFPAHTEQPSAPVLLDGQQELFAFYAALMARGWTLSPSATRRAPYMVNLNWGEAFAARGRAAGASFPGFSLALVLLLPLGLAGFTALRAEP